MSSVTKVPRWRTYDATWQTVVGDIPVLVATHLNEMGIVPTGFRVGVGAWRVVFTGITPLFSATNLDYQVNGHTMRVNNKFPRWPMHYEGVDYFFYGGYGTTYVTFDLTDAAKVLIDAVVYFRVTIRQFY